MCNPLSSVLTQARHAVIDPNAPRASDAIGGWDQMAIPIGIVLVVCVLGFWMFNRVAPRVAEEL